MGQPVKGPGGAARRGLAVALGWLAGAGVVAAAAVLLEPEAWSGERVRAAAAWYLVVGLVLGCGTTSVSELVSSHREIREERRCRPERERRVAEAVAALRAYRDRSAPPADGGGN